jgi:hypothetical protein
MNAILNYAIIKPKELNEFDRIFQGDFSHALALDYICWFLSCSLYILGSWNV